MIMMEIPYKKEIMIIFYKCGLRSFEERMKKEKSGENKIGLHTSNIKYDWRGVSGADDVTTSGLGCFGSLSLLYSVRGSTSSL